MTQPHIILLHIYLLVNSKTTSGQRRVLTAPINDISDKIFGGDQASLYEYTFNAIIVKFATEKKSMALDYQSDVVEHAGVGKLVCGGAIIHKDWIITAARCIYNETNLDKYEIHVGVINLKTEEGEQIRHIEKLSIHPNYNANSDEYNIAMIKVTSSFKITTYVSAGNLPVQPLAITGTERCHILGFVREYQPESEAYVERLIKVQLHVIDHNECVARLHLLRKKPRFMISQNNYCLVQIQEFPLNNSQGACGGDIGGPCVCGFKVQGLIAHASNYSCFTKKYPTTIVDVGYHLNWIRANILQLNVVGRSLAIKMTSLKLSLFKILLFLFLLFK